MPTRTALLLIATGPKYRDYAKKFIASADEFFVDHDTIIFTDDVGDFGGFRLAPIEYKYQGYPQASYMRYHAFAGARPLISTYDQVFYSDVDMRFVVPIKGEDIFSEGITATEHPGYIGQAGTPETNPASMAYCPHVRTYFCGGFNGGSSAAFLNMSVDIAKDIDIDRSRDVQAVWVDESHTNRYLFEHPPARILTPSFCYPEKDEFYKTIWAKAGRGPFEPKLIAIEKGGR